MKFAILAPLTWTAIILVYATPKSHSEANRLATSTEIKPEGSPATNIIGGGDTVVKNNDENKASSATAINERMAGDINPKSEHESVSTNSDMSVEDQTVAESSKASMPLLSLMHQNDAIPGYIEYVPIPPSAYIPLTRFPSSFDPNNPSSQVSLKGLRPGFDPRTRLAARFAFPFGFGSTGQQQPPSGKPIPQPRPGSKDGSPRKTPTPKPSPQKTPTSPPPTKDVSKAPNEPAIELTPEPLETTRLTSIPKKSQTKPTPKPDPPKTPASQPRSPSKPKAESSTQTDRNYQSTATSETDETEKPSSPKKSRTKPAPKSGSPKKRTKKPRSPTKPEPKSVDLTGPKNQPTEPIKPTPPKKSPRKRSPTTGSEKKRTQEKGSPKKRTPQPPSPKKAAEKPRSQAKRASSGKDTSGSPKRPAKSKARIKTCFCRIVQRPRKRCYSFTNLKTGECRPHRCPVRWRCVPKGYSKNICKRKIKTEQVELIPGSSNTCRRSRHRPKAYLIYYKHVNDVI